MEIYIKYKYRPKFGGSWSNGNETATVDDIVCNESYHEVRDQYDNTNLNTTEIYNDYGGTDRRLTNHDTSHWSKIWIVQSSM